MIIISPRESKLHARVSLSYPGNVIKIKTAHIYIITNRRSNARYLSFTLLPIERVWGKLCWREASQHMARGTENSAPHAHYVVVVFECTNSPHAPSQRLDLAARRGRCSAACQCHIASVILPIRQLWSVHENQA